MNLSTKLTQLRKAKGLSQDDLAEKLNLSRQAVYKWETGQSTPDIDNLKLLSSIYNITVDNLLNDNEELQYKGENKKISYGKPIILNVPNSNSAERDNTMLLEDDAKKVKIRKMALIISFCVMMLLPLSFILPFVFGETDMVYTIASVFLFIGLFGFLVWALIEKFLYAKIRGERNYFKYMKSKYEQILKDKGYKYFILQNDLLQWFYYNPKEKTFGFYFDDKEQFICPIQNYVSYSYQQENDGSMKVGNQYDVGVMVGALNGVGIQRSDKLAAQKQTAFPFSLKYCDENGELKDYKFFLSALRPYYVSMCKNKAEMLLYFNTVSISTKIAYDEIVALLDFEKQQLFLA